MGGLKWFRIYTPQQAQEVVLLPFKSIREVMPRAKATWLVSEGLALNPAPPDSRAGLRSEGSGGGHEMMEVAVSLRR